MTYPGFSTWLFAWGIVFSAGARAEALSANDYTAEKDRISAEHKSAQKECDKVVDNSTDTRALQANDQASLEMAERAFQGSPDAKEICVQTADGKEKIALAELDYRRSPSDENRAKVEVARTDAAHALAKRKCADQTVEAQDACIRDVQAKNVAPQ